MLRRVFIWLQLKRRQNWFDVELRQWGSSLCGNWSPCILTDPVHHLLRLLTIWNVEIEALTFSLWYLEGASGLIHPILGTWLSWSAVRDATVELGWCCFKAASDWVDVIALPSESPLDKVIKIEMRLLVCLDYVHNLFLQAIELLAVSREGGATEITHDRVY